MKRKGQYIKPALELAYIYSEEGIATSSAKVSTGGNTKDNAFEVEGWGEEEIGGPRQQGDY